MTLPARAARLVHYEMGTGTMPFRGESSGVITEAILNRNPPAPVRLNPTVPAKLENIICKAMEKYINLRYQNAADMRAELKRLRRDSETGLGEAADDKKEAVLTPSAARPGSGLLNMSADVENEFFADGITEEIINALSQIENLRVAARSSAFSFKGKQVALQVIGGRLNVRTVSRVAFAGRATASVSRHNSSTSRMDTIYGPNGTTEK
jgi:serine/threonine protein kinase